ncbi:MAG TPA: hypothetical protein VH277_16115 [Gemmatimonadaceae bacterium]|jgi:hypothetical protein|nr:hypothetical protein [Gemmatimonadaceae bacterium]
MTSFRFAVVLAVVLAVCSAALAAGDGAAARTVRRSGCERVGAAVRRQQHHRDQLDYLG